MLLPTQKITVQWTKHNRKYYQSLGFTYTGDHTTFDVDIQDCKLQKESRILVQCDYCGCVYETNYDSFRKAHRLIAKDSCKHCVGKKSAETSLYKRQRYLYQKLLDACKSAGYILVTPQDEIINNHTRIQYMCPTHGVQEMRLANVLSGKRCPMCATDQSRARWQLHWTDVVKRVSALQCVVYNPREYINQTTKNLAISCPNCGHIFITSLRNFEQHGGQACPACSCHGESVGERVVRQWLERHNVQFMQEHWFSDCRDTKPLPFDFYLPQHNTVVEFDGKQHYETSAFFNHGNTQRHDSIKNKYCDDNNINIIRIPYWNMDQIDNILTQHIHLT